MTGAGSVLDIRSLRDNCANCLRTFLDTEDYGNRTMQNARVSAFVYHDRGRQVTKQLVDGLSETLKFNWLKLDQDGKDFPIILCYDCSLSFTQLFESYSNFMGRQRRGSVLSVVNDCLTDLFDKYDTSTLYNKILKDYLMKRKQVEAGRKGYENSRKLMGKF